jgi:hypothetical protein
MKQLFLLSLLMTTVASCGGSNSSHGDAGTAITGNAGGRSLSLVDAVFNNAAASGLEFNGVSTTLFVPTYPNVCAQLTAGNAFANSGLLFVGLADVAADGTAAPITTSGSYVIFSGSVPASSRSAQAFVEYLDSSCMRSSLVPATSGTITITRFGDRLVEGSVELTFGAGESLSGTFSSSLCDGFSPNSSAFATCN